MREWTPSEKRPLPSLHRIFGESLGDMLITDLSAARLDAKPLDLVCGPPLPPRMRLYLFNCTDHPSERKAGDYRIQLRLPGQERRQRGQLAQAPGAMLVLAGYVSEFDVFVFWDANAHQDFPYSKGIQVAASTVHHAAVHGLAEQQRDVRGSNYRELVVAARTDCLIAGVQRREEMSRQALLRNSPPEPAPSPDETT